MGYDISSTYVLEIPKDLVKKVDDILLKYVEDNGAEDGYLVPGIVHMDYDGRDDYYLDVLYDGENYIEENGTTVHDPTYVMYDTRNDIPSQYFIKNIVTMLKKNGIAISGYVLVDWDGQEYWADMFIDGEYKGDFSFEELVKDKFNKMKEELGKN